MPDLFYVLFDEVREEPLPAPFAPAEEVRRRGRRRSQRQALSGGVAVLAVLALGAGGLALAAEPTSTPPPPAHSSATTATTPAGPTPPNECELEPLPNPEGAYQSLVTGADPTGRFIVGVASANFRDEPQVQVVFWDGGQPISVEMPGEDPKLRDVNSQGVAIGTSYQSGDTATGWVYQDGDLTELPAGYRPSTINEQGAIVGSLSIGAARTRLVPVVWRSPTAEPEMLSVPDDTWSVNAEFVGSDGTVVGTGVDMDGDPDAVRSFIWSPDGVRQELPLPEVSDGTVINFAATSIRDGLVVGGAAVEPNDGTGVFFPIFSYEQRTGEFTDLAGDRMIVANASNSYGWIAGNTVDGLVLLASGTAVTLPYPEVPEDPGDRFALRPTVASISEDGRTLAGHVYIEDGSERSEQAVTFHEQAMTWRCR
jgi:hypothetical protein